MSRRPDALRVGYLAVDLRCRIWRWWFWGDTTLSVASAEAGLHRRLMNIWYKPQLVTSLVYLWWWCEPWIYPEAWTPQFVPAALPLLPHENIWCDVVHSHLPIRCFWNFGKLSKQVRQHIHTESSRRGFAVSILEDAHCHLLLQHLHWSSDHDLNIVTKYRLQTPARKLCLVAIV